MAIHCLERTSLLMATALQLFMSFKFGYADVQNSCSLGDTKFKIRSLVTNLKVK